MKPVADSNDDGILVDDQMISIAVGAACPLNEFPVGERVSLDEG